MKQWFICLLLISVFFQGVGGPAQASERMVGFSPGLPAAVPAVAAVVLAPILNGAHPYDKGKMTVPILKVVFMVGEIGLARWRMVLYSDILESLPTIACEEKQQLECERVKTFAQERLTQALFYADLTKTRKTTIGPGIVSLFFSYMTLFPRDMNTEKWVDLSLILSGFESWVSAGTGQSLEFSSLFRVIAELKEYQDTTEDQTPFLPLQGRLVRAGFWFNVSWSMYMTWIVLGGSGVWGFIALF